MKWIAHRWPNFSVDFPKLISCCIPVWIPNENCVKIGKSLIRWNGKILFFPPLFPSSSFSISLSHPSTSLFCHLIWMDIHCFVVCLCEISNMSHLSVLYFGAARDSQDELITKTNNRTSVRDKYKVMEQTNQKSAFTKQLQTGLCDNMWVCTIEILDVNSGAHTYIHINAQVQVYTQPTSVHVHTDTYHPIIQSQVANLPNNKWVIHTVYCALLLSSVSQRMCAGLIIFNGACDRLHYIIFPLCLRQWALCKAWQM